MAMAPVNASAERFKWIGSTNTVPMPLELWSRQSAGRAAEITSTPMRATARLATPPANASSTLSTSSWRTIRPRDAPIASRTAISRRRPAARTRNRFATFAHATSSTSPTALNKQEESAAVAVVDARRVERVRRNPPVPRARPVFRKARVDARPDLSRDRRSAFGGHARRQAANHEEGVAARVEKVRGVPCRRAD